ncbi:MAG: M20/M25/M40 family metallo-hydrolase [Deltaproteobacteria bacterium]|nr:M20/M25/M40 family metallo-hydrolase [Deltaproteobacteria bacterium]
MNKNSVKIDEDGLMAFTQKLIRTPSLSLQEKDAANLVAEKMHEIGFDAVEIDPIHNVTGTLYGDDPEPELIFNGHLDHVPPGDMPDPYSGKIADGSKYGVKGRVIEGRGACDMKGALASMIYGAKALVDSGVRLKKSFVMTAVVREEMAKGEGILRLLEQEGLKGKMAVSGEATRLQTHLGHRGKLEFTIGVKGKTAHASNPSRGINAIYKMCDLIGDIRRNYRLSSHPMLGDCTFTVIDIVSKPGRLGPITPDWCEIALDRRYLPDETAVSVQKEIQGFIDDRSKNDPDFKAMVELVKDFPPLYCPEDEPVVKIIQEARGSVLGEKGELSTWKFGVDGTFIQRAGIPCAGFGPGDERFAHTPEDHVPIADLIASCDVYAEIIRSACAC